jgi:amino acid transporter
MNIPLNAIIVSLVIVALVSLINIGSTVALNAINSITISSLMSSYILTIGCLIYRRLRGDPLPARRWSLGRYGMAVNIASMIFLFPMFVFAFFPIATPVEPDSMNWGCLLFGGVIIIAGVYYAVWGHKVYTPPVRLLKREHYEI